MMKKSNYLSLLLVATLVGCGGSGSDATTTPAPIPAAEPAPEPDPEPEPEFSVCSESDVCIFEEQLSEHWTMSIFEDNTKETFLGTNGTTTNSYWDVIDLQDDDHGQVIEVKLYHSTGYADFSFKPILAGDLDSTSTHTVDLSTYLAGELVYDLRVVDWADNEIGIFMNLQCGWPCRSQFFPVANQSGENGIAREGFPLVLNANEWQEVRIPMQYFVDDNLTGSDPWLDLTKVDVISIAPPWQRPESQRDIHYQIDNLRIEAAPAP